VNGGIAQAFEPVGGETVNEWGTNKRMETTDHRQQTAVCRTGFPARQRMDGGQQWTAAAQPNLSVLPGDTVNEGENAIRLFVN